MNSKTVDQLDEETFRKYLDKFLSDAKRRKIEIPELAELREQLKHCIPYEPKRRVIGDDNELGAIVGLGLSKKAAEQLVALVKERDELKEANTHSAELLKTAKDLLDGTHNLCDVVDSEEWLWKWRVRYYLEETDIPVHEIPQDMK